MLCNLMFDIITSITRRRQTQSLKRSYLLMEAYYDDKYVWKITHNMTARFIYIFWTQRAALYAPQRKQLKGARLPVFTIPDKYFEYSLRSEKEQRRFFYFFISFFLACICKLPSSRALMENACRISGGGGEAPIHFNPEGNYSAGF